jgi:hypothetical protein
LSKTVLRIEFNGFVTRVYELAKQFQVFPQVGHVMYIQEVYHSVICNRKNWNHHKNPVLDIGLVIISQSILKGSQVLRSLTCNFKRMSCSSNFKK